MRPNNICCMVVGDHLGGPACCVIAYKCPEVRVTILGNEKVISELNSETLSNRETDLEHIIRKCRNRNLFFSSDYSSVIRDSDLIFISISDSSKATGTAEGNPINLKQLEETVKLIAMYTESDTIVVENSRIPVKAAERISTMLPSPRQSQVRFQVISNPEFLTEGSALDDLLMPERVLIGCQNNPVSRAAAETLSELYEHWIPQKNILILNERSAELCKLAGSAFLAQRISNMNSLSELCEQTDADIAEISNILGKDSRIGSKFLHPSAGFGLFQKEISSLVSLCQSLKLTEAASYWQAVVDMNEYQKIRCFRKIESILGPPRGKEIAIWGFSYEKNTCDTKNSPAIEVCHWLLTEESKVKIYDPKVPAEQILKDLLVGTAEGSRQNIEICSDVYQASANSSAIIICTDWDEFNEVDYSRVAQEMSIPLIIDGKKFLKEESIKDCGVGLHTIALNYINM